MKNEVLMNSLSEEVKQKLVGCRTAEEAKKVLSEAGVEPLDDELLDGVAGGELRETPNIYYGGFYPASEGSSGGNSGFYTIIK